MLRRSLAIALASVALFATAARADIIVGSFSGTLAQGTIDQLGVFAPANSNLSGDSFSGGFQIDTGQTGAATSCMLGTVCERTMGASSASFLTLTIAGTTFTVAGNHEAAALAAQNTATHVTTYQVAAQNSLSADTLFGNFMDPTLPGAPATMLEAISLSGGANEGLFRIIVNGADLELFNAAAYTLTVTDPSVIAVAEPPAWALAAGGLILPLAVGLRRRVPNRVAAGAA